MMSTALPEQNKIGDEKLSGSDLSREELAEIIRRVKGGDKRVFGLIYDCYADRIYRYVFFKTNHLFDAEDLTAEVFLKAFENIQSYEIRDCPFSAWLYRIAHNAVVDYYRLKGKTPLKTLEEGDIPTSEHHDPEIVILSNLDSEALCQALERLTEEQREVVLLRFIEGLPARQVAEIMEKPEGAVRALQRRGLKALSRIFRSK